MNIEPNWTVTNQGPWQLIYNDTSIISLSQTIGTTSTEGKVFAGTQEDCEAERVRLNLPWASEIETIYKLIHDGTHILSFSVNVDSSNVEGTTVVGTFRECQQEINRLGLTYTSSEFVEEPVNDSDTP